MNKTLETKRLIPEIVIIIAGCAIFGIYGLLMWGKHTKTIKAYDGQWVEDIQKMGDFWSVGFLKITKGEKP